MGENYDDIESILEFQRGILLNISTQIEQMRTQMLRLQDDRKRIRASIKKLEAVKKEELRKKK